MGPRWGPGQNMGPIGRMGPKWKIWMGPTCIRKFFKGIRYWSLMKAAMASAWAPAS